MTDFAVDKVRDDLQICHFSEMVWAFFDFLRDRYPEMLAEIDEYIEHQNVAGQLQAFRQYYNPPQGEAFLATADGKPVGICLLKAREGSGELNRMFVHKKARGLGLGRLLAQSVIDEARRQGHETLFLGALYRHEEALALYESLGFKRYRDENELHGDNPRVIHMRMDLCEVTQ